MKVGDAVLDIDAHTAPALHVGRSTSSLPTTIIMKFAGIAAIIALAGFALADSPAPPAELVIDRTYIPEACSVTAQNGDSIEVHYKGTLFANGNKFDSRCVDLHFDPPHAHASIHSYDRDRPLPLTRAYFALADPIAPTPLQLALARSSRDGTKALSACVRARSVR